MPHLKRRAMVASVVGGLVGGVIGAGVMSAGHNLVTALTGPAPTEVKDEDSTVKIAERVSALVRHRPLDESEKPAAGTIVHYGFGAATGLAYGVIAPAMPVITAGAGSVWGAAVWLGAHATVVPALGLARSPLQQPFAKEALELVLHLAYGVTVGLVQRLAIRISR